MPIGEVINYLAERQISDRTRLQRVVGLFQRELGAVFGNASVRRRNRRFEINLAVYEKPLVGGRAFQMPDRQIREWIRQAAEKAHPRLYKRLTVAVQPWKSGSVTHRLFAPVQILVDASESQ